MAKSSSGSISPRKALKLLFRSRSSTNLQQSGEDEQKKSSSFFKSRWKKRSDNRVGSAVTGSVEDRVEEEWPESSAYATAPRSKKGLFSSETDLHQSKRFAPFSFTWRKKKKNKGLSQSVSSIDVDADARHTSLMTVTEAASSQEVQSDSDKPEPSLIHRTHHPESSPNDEERPSEGGFMPAHREDMYITFIDEDIQSRPESPGVGHEFRSGHEPGTEDEVDVQSPGETPSASSIDSSIVSGHQVVGGTKSEDSSRPLQDPVVTEEPVVDPTPDFEKLEESTLTDMMLDFMTSRFASSGSPTPANVDSRHPEESSSEVTDTRPEETMLEPPLVTSDGDANVLSRFFTPIIESLSQKENLDHNIGSDVPQDEFVLNQGPESSSDHSEDASEERLDPTDIPLSVTHSWSIDVSDPESDLDQLHEANIFTKNDVEEGSPYGRTDSSAMHETDHLAGRVLPESGGSAHLTSASTRDVFKPSSSEFLTTSLCRSDTVSTCSENQKANEVGLGGEGQTVAREPASDAEAGEMKGHRLASDARITDNNLALERPLGPVDLVNVGPSFDELETTEEHLEERLGLKRQAGDVHGADGFRHKSEDLEILPREGAPAEVDQRHEDVPAVKPVAPARPVCVFEECGAAPPCSLHGQVSMTGSGLETLPHPGTGSRHSQRSPFTIPVREDPAGGGAKVSVVGIHVEREDIKTREPVTPSSSDGAARRSCPAVEEPGSLCEAPEGIDYDKDTPKEPAGVVVYVREFDPGRLVIEDDCSSDLRPAPRLSASERFLHAVPVLTPVAEESDADMSSSVVSATFTLRPKAPQPGRDDGKRVHKVSLVSYGAASMSSPLRDGVTDENGPKTDWGVVTETVGDPTGRADYLSVTEGSGRSTMERPDPGFVSEVSGYSYLYSSDSSPRYEPSAYSPCLTSGREREAPPAVAMDADAGSDWWSVRSEVRESAEARSGRRSWVEPAEPPGERDVGGTGAGSDWNSGTDQADGFFPGVFTATRVDLSPSPTDADPKPPVASPAHEMDALKDTLRSMVPPVRHRPPQKASSLGFSSLAPIVEDAPGALPAPVSGPSSPVSSLPPDLGLSWSAKDLRTPFSLMLDQKGQETSARGLILPSRASAISSMVMRKISLPNLALEEPPQVNGFLGTSRLEHSLLFSGYRSNQREENGHASNHRGLYRAASLPDVKSGHDYLGSVSKGPDLFTASPLPSYELAAAAASSLPGTTEPQRISRSSLVVHSPPPMSPTSTLTPSPNLELYRTLSPESSHRPPSLQRRLSAGASSMESLVPNGFGDFGVAPGPDRNLLAKYRAFPDAYRTKEKEHGKLNPRPGKMFIYNRAGREGQRIEVRGDVVDATAWKFPEDVISVRVVRGGWVLYEKPDFKGQKIALDEGDDEIRYPFGPQGNDDGNAPNGTHQDGEEPEPAEPRGFMIGSLRRAVRDYSVPEICLFPEENAEGKKVVFRDTSDDARIYGFPIKANSIIVNAGLWLVFAEPFFQGVHRVLEVGGFPNPAAWGVTHPYVGSLHPLKIGEPTVERPNEPKLVIYEKPYFTGKSRDIYTNMRDFISRKDHQQTAFMYSVGSVKVIGGIWVGYEKEGFRGHQYLLEEGEYQDWRTWGGCDAELRSVRVIRTDLSQPMLEMFEMSNDDEELDEERRLDVTEAIPDVELLDFRPVTRSVHVLSGAWIAYSHVDFSGSQYVLEKGFYNSCADWGAADNRICSVQPILPALTDGLGFQSELLLYSEPDFQGTCQMHCELEASLPERRPVQSCRVVGGSWVLYDDTSFEGNQYVLSEGDYANLTSMGCSEKCVLKSVKPVPSTFTIPSISMYGLECFEGRSVTLDNEVSSMMEKGLNPHFLSVKVNSGYWVLCEHSNYRGRQFLLEPIEITNWPKFSSLDTIGSLYPVREKKRLFRMRYKESGHYMSVQGGVDAMKTGRVVASENVEGSSDVWYYEEGLIKNKLAEAMSLQVIGNVEFGAKVVLWSETRTPIQTWSAQLSGTISSLTFPGLVLDVKGGKTYDKEHVIVCSASEESLTPLWEIELL